MGTHHAPESRSFWASFSPRELLHLGASSLALSVALALVLGARRGNVFEPSFDVDWALLLRLLPIAAAIVIPAFILHELAHKFVAIKRGMFAEYVAHFVLVNRRIPTGLIPGLFLSLYLKFILVAPGAVDIYADISLPQAKEMLRDAKEAGDPELERDARELIREIVDHEGRISVPGPLVNIALAAGALALGRAYPRATVGDISAMGVGNIFDVVVVLNLVLAAFNMIPLGPLDGRKVLRWSVLAFFGVWALIAAIGIGLVSSGTVQM